MTGVLHEQNMEKQHIDKQMGCMAGFLQIFDRHQILTGKRLYATKSLPLSTGIDSTPVSKKSMGSPAMSRELEKQQQTKSVPSPDRFKKSPVVELRSPAAPKCSAPVEIQSKPLLPLAVFELNEGIKSPWKFCKEAPRLSLDSRATFDAKGSLKPREIRTNASILSANRRENNGEQPDDNDKQRRSPSVIARLIGLEPLLDSDSEQVKKPELRRSASESRASRDLFQYRFIDGVNFQLKRTQHQNTQSNVNKGAKDQKPNGRAVDPKPYNVDPNARAEPARAQYKGIGQRKSFFDSVDFFPESKQTGQIYGEIEKRLKMRGIDEPSKDLETVKQILEALQLKGLLRSKNPINRTNQRNLEHDGSPIVVMKPLKPPVSTNRPTGRRINDSPPSSYRARPGIGRDSNYCGDTLSGTSPRRERPEVEKNARSQIRGRNLSSPMTSENGGRSPNRRRPSPSRVESHRRVGSDSAEQRRVSPVQSPKICAGRTGFDRTTNRSPRRKPTVEIYQKDEKVFVPTEDELLSAVSESSTSTSSRNDIERSDYSEGRSLLERCDKLLHSIAEITANELQPSPVSVLDSSFYKEESPPSPVMKRCADFKDQSAELEDDIWSTAICQSQSEDDCDFMYISDVLRASSYMAEDSDVFQLLEKKRFLKGKDNSKASTLQRMLVFDTINEILDRQRRLPPWKAVSLTNCWRGRASLQQIWCEYRRICERGKSDDDLLEVICGVLRKDLEGDDAWGDCPVEMSEAVLDVERLIFKDLIGETIRDLIAFFWKGKCNQLVTLPRRKLLF